MLLSTLASVDEESANSPVSLQRPAIFNSLRSGLKAAQRERKANSRDKTVKLIRFITPAEQARSSVGRSCNPRERSWSTPATSHTEERGI
ncbi:hypothetical protein [Paraburkholderia domus]|jgi:hypothetical protein|uniref:hypothetical protein n=1 Tax=Paraburkholderia domus TaxID=2793075 RepID=UPI0019148A83|nr:hypothetical protein [Paraburkholderia domus]MBK5053902.1 hypothetical protein [Burkholderia sp. R-70006]MBK5063969.1 hypothetical protein [Burkholderia sp. R-70199]MBK5125554.1 hypothetical protein [Burkholderia sp. R-69980]MBK5169669.1 hypothetical protein [Burkholderia sp. R-70211]MBK5185371.1 hypothetical protein [Burkholderia sp. R-69749]MCI0150111.1 hypothetical protein [Paraburkholderia sediminicola]